jgi:hypothetical protein
MPKLTLKDPGANFRSVQQIKSNNDAIEAAVEKTLSRDGTAPNQMEAVLDMNSNRIINLPEPAADTDPVRRVDVDSGIGADITVVAGIAADVTTVAGDSADIQTVAADLNGSDTIGSVASLISSGTPGFISVASAGVANVRTLTAGSGIAISNPTGAAGNPQITLDAELVDIANISPGDGVFIVGDGSDFVGESGDTALTSLGAGTVGLQLFKDNTAADARNELGLGTAQSPTFGGLTVSGVVVSPTGAAVGQALGFPNSTTTLEPYTPAGGGDVLAAANTTFTGINAGGQADTIAALAARSVAGLTDGDIIYVSDAYRWGFFRWTTGNQSGHVTADSKQGIWVAPDSADTGASGAWQRLVDGSIRVDWFIEPGDADDTAGIQAALNYAAAGEGVGNVFQRGTTVIFGRETYTISAEIKPAGFGYIVLQGQGLPNISSVINGITGEPTTSSGGTTVIGTHTSGSVFRFERGPVGVRSMRVTGSAARKAGANLSAHGLHFEPEDTAANGARINSVQLMDVVVDNQPGIGIAVIGNSVNTEFNRVFTSLNGSHGVAVDRGDAVGRVHTMFGGTALTDGAMTAASAVLTASSASFVDPTDVGERILVKGAGPNGYDLETSISSVDSATQVTLATSASTTVSGAVVQYGGTWARPGLGTINKLNTSDNGGHGLALGHPANRFQTPYRWRIYDLESFRNSLTSARRYSNNDTWACGEQIRIEKSAATGGASGSPFFVSGESVRIVQCRAVDVVTGNVGVRIANALAARTLNGVDTGLSRAEFEDVQVNGLQVLGDTITNAVQIDDTSDGYVNVEGVHGDFTNVVNAQRNNLSYVADSKNYSTRPFRLATGSAAAPSLSFTGDEDTGLLRNTTNSLQIAAGGEAAVTVTQSAVTLAPSTTAAPDGVVLHTARGNAAVPAFSFGTDTDTGVFSRTANEVNLAAGGVEILRATTTQLQVGLRGTAALPVFTSLNDTNTGMFFPFASGNDAVGISTGGTERVRVKTEGVDILSGDLLHGGTKVVGARVINANIADPAAITAQALTDNSGGSASTTIAAIGAAYDQAEVRNAVASLAAQVNNLKADVDELRAKLVAANTTIRTHGLGAAS